MNNRLRITYKDMDRTEHLAAFIEGRFERLRKITRDLIRCNVVVSSPHRSHRNGNAHEATVDLRIPGKEYVGHSRSRSDAATDVYSAINEAFNSLHKQLTTRKRPSSPPPRFDIAPPQVMPAKAPAASTATA